MLEELHSLLCEVTEQYLAYIKAGDCQAAYDEFEKGVKNGVDRKLLTIYVSIHMEEN